jgi:F0F1-type ATP synthase epsilon subunit
VRVLAELAETADEIDIERAKDAEKKAKDILLTGAPTTSSWEEEESRQNKYESKLKRSIVRQKVAQFL